MLRVLTLSTLFPDASRPNFGIFVERQVQALVQRPDVAVRVVAPVGLPPRPLAGLARYRPLSRLPERETWNGLETYRPRFVNLPGIGGRAHVAMLTRALAPLLREIRGDFPFDLITAEFFFPDGPAAITLGEQLGVPVSIKARGSDIHRWARRPGTAAKVLAAARRANGMVSVSEAMRDDMIALGMPGERIRCIVSGVDLERFGLRDRTEAKRALDTPSSLVVSVGALIPVKGHDLLIDAFAKLPGTSLWIAGEGPERPRLAARIARLGIGDRVRLLGAVPHDTIPALLAAADVMALASASEGLANAWLEALASGTPIVIPDVGGARQVLKSEVAGRIVTRTPEAFAEAIAALVAEPPARARVRTQAEPFTWAANSARMHAYFSSLCAAGEPKPIDIRPDPLPSGPPKEVQSMAKKDKKDSKPPKAPAGAAIPKALRKQGQNLAKLARHPLVADVVAAGIAAVASRLTRKAAASSAAASQTPAAAPAKAKAPAKGKAAKPKAPAKPSAAPAAPKAAAKPKAPKPEAPAKKAAAKPKAAASTPPAKTDAAATPKPTAAKKPTPPRRTTRRAAPKTTR